MTLSHSDFSIETLTLPHEDPLEHASLFNAWLRAESPGGLRERALIEQAVRALIEKRRLERIRAATRTQTVRTAVLYFDRKQDDDVAKCLHHFNVHCPSALVGLTRSAAGCRWAIAYFERLAALLVSEGTWYGDCRNGAIQLQGFSACINELYLSEEAYTTWIDCLAAQPNPKPDDIEVILERKYVPKSLLDRDVPLWPRDPVESRARLQALVDRELPRLRALEETLRTQYEEPARAEAHLTALAQAAKEELPLLRAQRIHEQSYQQALTALLKLRKAPAASPPPAAREVVETALILRPRVLSSGPRPVVGRSEHRSAVGRAGAGAVRAWGVGVGAWGRSAIPPPSVRRHLPRSPTPNPQAPSPEPQAGGSGRFLSLDGYA
jgi:hypothetical protein